MHPILFSYGPLTVYSYGLCVALAFLAAIATAAARAGRYGWKPEIIYDISIYVILAALLGSRLLYILDNPDEFLNSPLDVFKIWKGGLVYYGGVMAAIAAGALYLRIHRLGVLNGFDLLIPSVALGHAIGRIGCFLNGCCFGALCSKPWAVVFPAGSPVYYHQLYESGVIAPGSRYTLPVHPTQLYEAAIELLIFCMLSFTLARRRFNGQVFFLYFVLYGAVRFVVEIFRADNPVAIKIGMLGFTLPQIMSFAAAWAAAIILIIMGRRCVERKEGCAPANPSKGGSL